MKTLGIALFLAGMVSGVALGDQAGDYGMAGFADALRRQIEMRQAAEQGYRYQAYQEEQARQEELRLLREQVDLQRQELELERRKHRESLYKN